MGWVWSDELANSLKSSPETAQLVPQGWTARPCAFSAGPDEDLQMTGRRLLGLGPADQPKPTSAAEITAAGITAAGISAAGITVAETADGKASCTCR